jgi:hypothetical protein
VAEPQQRNPEERAWLELTPGGTLLRVSQIEAWVPGVSGDPAAVHTKSGRQFHTYFPTPQAGIRAVTAATQRVVDADPSLRPPADYERGW